MTNQTSNDPPIVIGLLVEDAAQALLDAGFRWRFSSINGVPCVVTHDYRTDRINLHVKDDKVFATYRG